MDLCINEFVCAGAEDVVNVIVEGGAVPALVKHLQAPPCSEGDRRSSKHCEHEVEKGSAFALGLLAVKVTLRFKIFKFSIQLKLPFILFYFIFINFLDIQQRYI